MENIDKEAEETEKSKIIQEGNQVWLDHPKLGIICLERKEHRDKRLKIGEELNKDWDNLMKEKDENIARRIGEGANEEEMNQERLTFQKKAEKYKQIQLEEKLAEDRINQFKDHELVNEFEIVSKHDFVTYKKDGENLVGLVVEMNGQKTFKILIDLEYRLLRARLCSKVFFLDCVVYLKDSVLEKKIEVDINSKMDMLFSFEVSTALQDLFSISNFCFVNGMKVKIVKNIDDKLDKEELLKNYKNANISTSYIDTRVYYKIDKKKEVIYIDKNAKLAQVLPLHNNPLEILLITPENLRGVQLYKEVRYGPASNLTCRLTANKSISIHGIGIYGPYPNTEAHQSFKYMLELKNLTSGDTSTNSLLIENEEPAIWKLFFYKPIVVEEDDCFQVKCKEDISRGLVFAMKSEDGVFYGDDGIRFNVENFTDHFLASIYYTSI